MTDKYYVYAHRKETNGEIFYVGKGSGKRAYKKDRSDWWKNIVNKHGRKVEILSDNLTEEDAFELEKFVISEMKGKLCNMTEGGEGSSGFKHSQESKDKLSAYWSGRPKGLRSEEANRKSAEAQWITYVVSKDGVDVEIKGRKNCAKLMGMNSAGNLSTYLDKDKKYKGYHVRRK